ncbi:MAG: metallophosphoesterase family protein, partial [Afipia sp.]
RNGGTQTLYSYQVPSVIDLPRRHLDWFRSLPTYYDDGTRFFVHAGVHPDRPLDQQKERDLLWIREPFLSSTKDFALLVIHGHSPTKSGRPEIRANRINIDTGAVYGGALTAAVFMNGEPSPIRFIQTPT